MDKLHVDEFFDTGRLRLSSFKHFAQLPDEAGRDKNEGKHPFWVSSTQGSIWAFGMWGRKDAYVLCSSRKADAPLQKFGNAAFIITDPTAFGLAIARKLKTFKAGMEGSCSYDTNVFSPEGKEENVFWVDAGDHSPLVHTNNGANSVIDAEASFRNASRHLNGAMFFHKHSRYRDELEYRWLWFIRDEAEEFTFVNIPEALQWCERLPDHSD
jgi:hypothetical protein